MRGEFNALLQLELYGLPSSARERDPRIFQRSLKLGFAMAPAHALIRGWGRVTFNFRLTFNI